MSYTEDDDLRIVIRTELYMYTYKNSLFPVCSGIVVPGVSPDSHLPYVSQVQTGPNTTATYLYEWDQTLNEYSHSILSTSRAECVPTMSWDANSDGNKWLPVPRADPVAQPVPMAGLAMWVQDPVSRPQVPVSLSDTEIDWKAKQDELCKWWQETKKDLGTYAIGLDTEASERGQR